MKQTVDTLKAAGWTGYTKGKITGNVFPARHVLDSMAWILNNQNKKNCQWTIRTTYDDLGKKFEFILFAGHGYRKNRMKSSQKGI